MFASKRVSPTHRSNDAGWSPGEADSRPDISRYVVFVPTLCGLANLLVFPRYILLFGQVIRRSLIAFRFYPSGPSKHSFSPQAGSCFRYPFTMHFNTSLVCLLATCSSSVAHAAARPRSPFSRSLQVRQDGGQLDPNVIQQASSSDGGPSDGQAPSAT